MKKQIAKLSLKTDQIISLSKAQASNVLGGRPPQKTVYTGCTTKGYCPTEL
ncbi:class I lanthipeptide [Larkinella sp. VNQ87]|uniref:class I lanthipeptide n=1 Tax=Larkinella sp. VNQ87 TaxID=3400921 RepID=UPI003C0768EF